MIHKKIKPTYNCMYVEIVFKYFLTRVGGRVAIGMALKYGLH